MAADSCWSCETDDPAFDFSAIDGCDSDVNPRMTRWRRQESLQSLDKVN